ncbi:MAG: hypothetical protein CMJ80_17605 [Planctomycetaceae bacterium]|jgi:hypothetical protein|nr:hypothetical protein [Planctomycetaceae bacterium]
MRGGILPRVCAGLVVVDTSGLIRTTPIIYQTTRRPAMRFAAGTRLQWGRSGMVQDVENGSDNRGSRLVFVFAKRFLLTRWKSVFDLLKTIR